MILGPILMGMLTFLFTKKKHTKILIPFQVLMLGASCFLFYEVRQQGTYSVRLGGWEEGVAISLVADPLSTLMMLLLTTIFLALVLFGYKEEYFNPQFGFLFFTLEGLLAGIFLSGDLFNLFIFLEVSTVVVSILIMFSKDKQAIYDGLIYLLVNVVGATFFLFGIGYLYKIFGILDFRLITSQMHLLEEPRIVILPYAFILTMLSLKTALMPLFSWLPKAHGTPSAPSVVSAILSGIYIKSGIYLFLRMSEMFQGAINIRGFFFVIAFLTAVIGFILALSQEDVKLILAYSTVSQVGVIMMGINMGSEVAYFGGIYHIINHALFKVTLFLAIGLITEVYGTRKLNEIRGVYKKMPSIAIASIFAILGIVGAPFFNGSISKYLIAYGSEDSWVQMGLNIANFGTILCFVRFSTLFFSKSTVEGVIDTPIIQAKNKAVLLGLGSLCLTSGIFGTQFISFFLGYQVNISLSGYLQKTFMFFLLWILAIGVYHFYLKQSTLHRKMRELEMSFNAICMAMTTYFLFLVIYLVAVT
jgi:multicomponent Na+:H+ antiporter subunit D